VELLVVIAIMLILAGAVAVNLMQEPGRARVARAQSDLAAFKTALQMYQADNLAPPSQRQGLQALVERPSLPPAPANWRAGGYHDRRSVPNDPWNNPYAYFQPGRQGEAFEVVSYGADGAPGGEGDDGDLTSADL
jgi:general secretion pathway protein G